MRGFDLEKGRFLWDYASMVTLKADDDRRVQLPQAKPGQVFAYEETGAGQITLTLVDSQRREAFPKGSLLEEVEDMNRETAELAKATVLGVPKVCRS